MIGYKSRYERGDMTKVSIMLVLAFLVFCMPLQGPFAGEYMSAREQLDQMVKQLQQNRFDETLRANIIKLARRLKPPPAIPHEAHNSSVIGSTLIEQGSTLRDAYQALLMFNQVENFAPWWGEAYWNAAVAADLAGMYNTEKWHLKYYLLSKPSDKAAVQDRLDAIEAKQIMAEAGSPADGIIGYWQYKQNPDDDYSQVIHITNTGGSYSVEDMSGLIDPDIVQVTYANNSSINYTLHIGSQSPLYYACKLNGNKLTCDLRDASSPRVEEDVFTHRALCEVVDDDHEVATENNLGKPVMCK